MTSLPWHRCTGVVQYVEPGYAISLLEQHPGGVGYLLKDRVFDGASLTEALRRFQEGESVVDPTIVSIVSRLLLRGRRVDPLAQLSPREREVLALVAEGLTNRAVAASLFVTSAPSKHTSRRRSSNCG